jgi:hypothetical protein
VAVAGVVAAAFAVSAALGGPDDAPRNAASDAQPGAAGDGDNVVADAQPSGGDRAGASRSGGPDEGIGVRGRWVLTVLNGDDSVAAAVEIDNAFVGGERLAEILSGRIHLLHLTVPPWSIELGLTEDSISGPCPAGENFLDESSASGETGGCFPSGPERRYAAFASIDAETDDSLVGLTLETEPFAGPATVDAVTSRLAWCTAPGFCTRTDFTSTDIDPQAIAAGQRILVTVTLSFGTLP